MKLLIVDGSNLLFQMFFGMPSRITGKDGRLIHGTLGFVRHKERNTYEIPGGHIEPGEHYMAAAKRELYEETGAKEYTLDFVSIYTVKTADKTSGGYLFFADVKELTALPDYEMAEVALMERLPENLTYPLIQPHLFNQVLEWMTSRRLEWGATPAREIH